MAFLNLSGIGQLSSLLKANKPVEAMKYLEEMMNCGLGADAIVYDLLLKALCRQAEVADALKICNIVIENRFSIGIATLFDLMKCLSKLGRVNEANDGLSKNVKWVSYNT